MPYDPHPLSHIQEQPDAMFLWQPLVPYSFCSACAVAVVPASCSSLESRS